MVKTNSTYAVKVAERSNHLLPVYLINHSAQTSILSNMYLIEHLLFNITFFLTYEKCLMWPSFYFNKFLYWTE